MLAYCMTRARKLFWTQENCQIVIPLQIDHCNDHWTFDSLTYDDVRVNISYFRDASMICLFTDQINTVSNEEEGFENKRF